MISSYSWVTIVDRLIHTTEEKSPATEEKGKLGRNILILMPNNLNFLQL
jgi:hypothetical protein